MQTNSLYAYCVEPDGAICFTSGSGHVTARVYDGRATFHSGIPLREVEVEYLLGTMQNFDALQAEAIRRAGNGIAHMPIVTAL
jgi:hypothetical protein